MLYSIIPPILFIISLIAIMLFLAKKASEMNLEREENVEKRGLFQSVSKRIKRVKWYHALHILVVILEKAIHGLKQSFLGVESRIKIWKKKARQKKEQEASGKGLVSEKSILDKLKDYKLEKKQHLEDDEIEEVRPMISDEVASPQPKIEMETKDRLEELLIERIAINPKDTEAYERLGEYYMEIKNHEFAKECFKQIMKLDPLNRNVKYRMRKLENLLSKK